MSSIAFAGMRGTGDWVADQRPQNWRQMYLYYYPAGEAPLVALTSMMDSEKVDDPQYNYWTKEMPGRRVTPTGFFTEATLTTPVDTSGAGLADGATVYVEVATEAELKFFRAEQLAIVAKQGSLILRYVVEIEATATIAGPKYYIKVITRETTSIAQQIEDGDLFIQFSNASAEGDTVKGAISYQPVREFNYTQIFRNSLDITRTAQRTRLRTPEQYQESKRECLELHAIDIEEAAYWGIRKEITSGTSTGKPKRFTEGFLPVMQRLAPNNVATFLVDHVGETWLSKGESWLDEKFELIYRTHGKGELMALVGSGAMAGLHKLAKNNSTYNISETVTSYGIRFRVWRTPWADVFLKLAPRFSENPYTRNDMMLVRPAEFRVRYIDDSFFKEDRSQETMQNDGRDGKNEEFLGELGFEWHNPGSQGYLSGVGLDG